MNAKEDLDWLKSAHMISLRVLFHQMLDFQIVLKVISICDLRIIVTPHHVQLYGDFTQEYCWFTNQSWHVNHVPHL